MFLSQNRSPQAPRLKASRFKISSLRAASSSVEPKASGSGLHKLCYMDAQLTLPHSLRLRRMLRTTHSASCIMGWTVRVDSRTSTYVVTARLYLSPRPDRVPCRGMFVLVFDCTSLAPGSGLGLTVPERMQV